MNSLGALLLLAAALASLLPAASAGRRSEFHFVNDHSLVRTIATNNAFGTFSYLVADLTTGQAAVRHPRLAQDAAPCLH